MEVEHQNNIESENNSDKLTDIVDKSLDNNLQVSDYSQSERFLSAVGYVSFLCLLPLLLRRDSEYCQYHGKQALITCIFFIVFEAIFSFLLNIVSVLLSGLLQLLILFAIGMMAYMAWQGKKFEIPVISDYAKKLKLSKEEEEEEQLEDMETEKEKAQKNE